MVSLHRPLEAAPLRLADDLNRVALGELVNQNLVADAHLRAVRVEGDGEVNVGDKVLVDQFAEGDAIEVVGKSKGRGFQGTVKRHHFNRGPESHGSMNVRKPGSIGQSAYPSRVIKGTRSSGHMGDRRVTVKGLTVARVDAENNLLMIRGAVPGANGSVVVVRKSGKK